MKKNSNLKNAFINALIAVGYIALVAVLMQNAGKILGPIENTALSIMSLLLVFVISAAAMGVAIFGRPVTMYLNGEKQSAIQLVFYTIGFLVLIALIIFLIIFSQSYVIG